jgi:hypothetical protein
MRASEEGDVRNSHDSAQDKEHKEAVPHGWSAEGAGTPFAICGRLMEVHKKNEAGSRVSTVQYSTLMAVARCPSTDDPCCLKLDGYFEGVVVFAPKGGEGKDGRQ